MAVIIILLELAMISPMILNKITETKRLNSKKHKDSTCDVKAIEP